MDLGLEDRVVVVTGGSRNIGEATVRTFAAEGARVVLTYAHDRDRAERLVEELGGEKRTLAVPYDIDDPASCERLLPAAQEHFGPVDVLVANAVRRPLRRTSPRFEDLDPQDWAAFLTANLVATMRTVQLAVAGMRERGQGRIALVSSHVAQRGYVGQEVYAAAKSALHGFALGLARDAGPDGVLVNVFCPGLTTTEDTLAWMPAAKRDELATRMPTGRLGSPGDIARLIAFYCSAANQNIAGEVVSVVGHG